MAQTKKRVPKTDKIDVSGFSNNEKKIRYQREVATAIDSIQREANCQDKWKEICEITKQTGKRHLRLQIKFTSTQ